MHIERQTPGSTGYDDAIAACHDVWQAAQRADDPAGAPWSHGFFRAWVEHGFEGEPGELWTVPGTAASGGAGARGASAVDAWCRVGLPVRENLTVADVDIFVHPRARRRGLGTALLRHAAARARLADRTTLSGEAREDSAGLAFAERAGATRGITEIRRVLDLATQPPGKVARLRDQNAPKAAGYSFLRWLGRTPDEYAGRVAAVHEAMNDAPRDPGREPEAWDADRVRHDDALAEAFGCRYYQVAARHDATGDFAALTGLVVDPPYPDRGMITITAVARPHRGHRLGLLIKIAAQEWLAEAEPALRWIETGNASANPHMIAVNETLGYQITPPGLVSLELPVASQP